MLPKQEDKLNKLIRQDKINTPMLQDINIKEIYTVKIKRQMLFFGNNTK